MTTSEHDWNITELFPRFGEEQLIRFRSQCDLSEQEELDTMFEVVEKIDSKPTQHLVSTSIYCRPHDPGPARIEPLTLENLQTPHPSVRGGKAWWDIYFRPLLNDLSRIHPPWNLRIHLAEELSFLIPYLRHPRVEIWIMKHPSELTMPGMLWRYLPLEESVYLVARGIDSLWPPPNYWKMLDPFNDSDCRFFRSFLPRDQDRSGSIVYRTIPGPLVAKEGPPIPFIEYSKAWIWHQKKGLWPTNATIPGSDKEFPKFGLQHWAKYGQDEQFLSHWLYYLACEEGLYTVTDRDHHSRIIDYDKRYVQHSDEQSKFLAVAR